MVFDYARLPREFPRHFLPAELNFDWEGLEPIFGALAGRPISGPKDLERWMSDEAELDSFITEQKALRYFNSTRQTDNPEYTKAYELYLEVLEPKIKVAGFELLKKYASSRFRTDLPQSEYGLEDRRRASAVSVFRPENVELEKQDSALSQEYYRIAGAMTVEFRGQERTLQQMSKFLEEPDRALREEAWRTSNGRALKDRASLDSIYTKMVALRDRVSRNAGFANYRDYMFVKKDRFDYTPADCVRFHDAVAECIVPLSREIDEERRENLGLDTLRPWDLRVDPGGRPPLRPFDDVAELVSGAKRVVGGIDGQLAGFFERMVNLELLDLESRKGKAPGGYQEELTEVRLPFIFMNAAGKDSDVRTLLHECGHSFQIFLMREKGLPFFNSGVNLPSEFAEVASMSMEMVSGEHYEGVYYDREQSRRSNWDEAVGNVKLFAWVATIDAFQHWVYTHPGHTPEERTAAWVKIYNRFCGLEGYEGLEDSRAYRWQRQLHLFEVPFYYIEYGIALTGALGIWSRYKKDPKDAIEAYKGALSLGASRPIPELFAAAGLDWDFGPAALRRVAEGLRSEIREYS